MADSEEPSDRELVQSFLRTRGESEFRVLYRRHTPALYRMAWRLVGAARAEDVVQETWWRAAQTLSRFEWRSALRTWLTAILIRCCREAQRVPGALVAFTREAAQEVPEPAISAADALDLERGLAALAPGYREVIVLHDVEGMTHEEIARALNVVPGTSKSQLARARRALREYLAGGVLASNEDKRR